MNDRPLCYACHCLDCQTLSGSAFALHALIPEAQLELTGEVINYGKSGGPAGRSVERLCAHCHTRLFMTIAAMPGAAILRAGTLKESSSLRPAVHIWTRRKQDWIAIPDGVPSFEESPTPEAFARATGAV